MNYLVFVACFSICAADEATVSKEIKKYYESGSLTNMKKLWENYREAMEHALSVAMQETVGRDGLNVISLKGISMLLTNSYYQAQGEVEIIFRDLVLRELPQTWMPDAVMSLASNVLRIESTLTHMIITANYYLMRNKNEIIFDSNPDTFKASPFLFSQITNAGDVAIRAENCILTGDVILRIKSGRVLLGHENFQLRDCEYFVEIYRNGDGNIPVMGQITVDNIKSALGLRHYLLMTIREDLLTKIQGALFSFVNTTDIFGKKLGTYETEQESIFRKTAMGMTEYVRKLNDNIYKLNAGKVKLHDYCSVWNYWDSVSPKNGNGSMKLSQMYLTGLDSIYCDSTGGPFKLNDRRIGEQLKFKLLQVRGKLVLPNEDFDFAVVISDLAVNIVISVAQERFKVLKTEVVSYRAIEFIHHDLMLGPIQTMITAYLKDEVPTIVIGILENVTKGGARRRSSLLRKQAVNNAIRNSLS